MKPLTRIILTTILLLFTVNCSLLTLNAAVPHLINYQGKLTDKETNKPIDKPCKLGFQIYDSQGQLLWQKTYDNYTPQNGLFSITLGEQSDAGYDFNQLKFDQPYYLQIIVNDEKMGVKQQISAAGYAIRAEKAEGVSGITNFFPASGNVGIGTASPADKLDVSGAIAINSKRVIDNSGNWVGSPTNLIGPAGPQGPTGPQGPQGPPGPAVHTSAVCGYTGGCLPEGSDAMSYCSAICKGTSNMIAGKCGPCFVSSDTGSCNASANSVCCVCKP